MKKIIVLTFFTITIFCTSLFAQKLEYSPKQIIHENGVFSTQIIKWETKDWLLVGGGCAATFLLMETADKNVQNAALTGTRKYLGTFTVTSGNLYGSQYIFPSIGGVFALIYFTSKNYKAKKFSYEVMQTGLYSIALVGALKFIIGRERPDYENGKVFKFHPFDFNNITSQRYVSLPSGHAAISFGLSTIISRNIKNKWLKVLAYVPSLVTVNARVYENVHWTSDIFAGALIGYFVGTWVVNFHENEEARLKMSSLYPMKISYSLSKPKKNLTYKSAY